MEHIEQKSIVLKDPLTPTTRKARRNLLVTSLIAVIIVFTGLIPTKITALGVEFTEVNQISLLIILGLVVMYFLMAFAIFGISDYRSWKLMTEEKDLFKLVSKELDKLYSIDEDNLDGQDKFEHMERKGYLEKLHPILKTDRRIGFFRSRYFEVVMPFAIGLFAIGAVLFEVIITYRCS